MNRTLNKIAKLSRTVQIRLREQGLRITTLWAYDHAIRIVAGAPRPETSRIVPGLVVGGQYRARGWRRLQAAGITSVINLRAEYCDQKAGIAPEGYLWLPTIDDEPPTMEQLRRGVAFIDSQLSLGGAVYIHCGAGVGRAATMAAAYLVALGATPGGAWATIRRARPFIRPTPRQQEAIEQWCSLLGAEPYVTITRPTPQPIS